MGAIILQQCSNLMAVTNKDCKTFVFVNETHTPANALRKVLTFDENGVQYCGYSIPHPAKSELNLRLETCDGTECKDKLAKGIENLKLTSEAFLDKFDEAYEKFISEKKMEF